MPWHALAAPSIQLGTLQAVLSRAGVPCQTHSLHLEFMEFLQHAGTQGAALLGLDDYREIGDRWFMWSPGEWVFAVPPTRSASASVDKRFLGQLRTEGMCGRLLKRLAALKRRIPAFLEASATEILDSGASVVGFTTTFGQTVASLALAARLKERDPGIAIVFGGANCDGSMGEVLHRSFPWVDVVVRGEGEPVVPALMRSLLAGEPVTEVPGLCYRDGERRVVVPERGSAAVEMAAVPVPDYDEYFDRLQRSRFAAAVQPVLPYESSRGCWWGEKSHCTFCGLNGSLMKHRSKPGGRVVAELMELSRKHGTLDFAVVDNILDQSYFHDALPELRARRLDLRLFYQTKANLRLDQLRMLRDAGVRTIRPGIESLSTPILRHMRKGVTALQNVRLLKWCAQYGIHVAWNVIYGLPGEAPEEYARMAELAPWLVHLAPPSLVRLTIDRFSPYHAEPERWGIEVLGPPRHYEALFDLEPAALRQLAWTFDYSTVNELQPSMYIDALAAVVARWRDDAELNKGALTLRRGPSFIEISDSRTTVGRRRYTLTDLEARAYLACDAGRDAPGLARELGVGLPIVQAMLDEFTAEHLLFEEAGRYLSLAIPEESLVCRRAGTADDADAADAAPSWEGDANVTSLSPDRTAAGGRRQPA